MSGLQNIRNNLSGVLAKIIAGAIIVTFALFFGWGTVFTGSDANNIAKVNGKNINVIDLGFETNAQQYLFSQRYDDLDLDEEVLRALATNSLIRRELVLQYLDELDVIIPEQIAYKEFMSDPSFQSEGRFSQERFEAVIRNMGFTTNDYISRVRKDKALNYWRSSIYDSNFFSRKRIEDLLELASQTRDLSFVPFKLEVEINNVKLNPEDTLQHYENTKEQYIKEEEVKLRYIQLDKNSLRSDIEILEKDVETEYAFYLDNFNTNPSRAASHIMINISEERSRDEAEKLINDISKQLSDKNNFLELVKLFSEDEATIDFEGSLGVSTGESFPKEFENALRVLKVGEFSEPIELDNSFHILLLTELNQPSPETYIKKSDSIREKLMEVQLNSNYFSLLDKANNLIYSSNDFTEISSSLGISAITTGFFSKDLLEEKLNYQIVEDFIFTEDRSNGISEVLEVDDSIAFILEVVDMNQATILSFEDVQNKVQDSLRSKLASEIIFKKSSDFINDVELSSFEEALKKNNITKQSYKEVSRDSSLLPNKALADLFGISRGTSNNELFISNQTNGDIFILSLDEVNDAAAEISEDQIDQFTKLMQQERVNSLVSQVQRSLEENADIVLLNNLDN